MRLTILIAIILVIVVTYITSIVKSFKIKFDEFANVAFKGFDINSLNLNQTIIAARVKLLISFNSFFSISISDLNIVVHKNGLLIAESTKGILENIKRISLNPNVDNQVLQTFDFHVNGELIDLITKIKAKQPYKINYQVRFKLFGIPLRKNGEIIK